MQTVALPKKIEYQESPDANQGKIIIEPCFPGFGTTLGNSLRRVLLSSLPGAAPIGVKIKGVSHEFMAVANLKEDVLEFILNLKMLRLKIFSDDVVKLELEIFGEKEIFAKDIKKNSLVEIVNPDLILGHITSLSGNLTIEIFVSKGMGYETIEARENKNKEIGYIEMDSIFSPVLSVGIKNENVRMGKMTNWDRLILDIKTDGIITPKEAFKQSAEILIEQFSSLIEDKKKSEEEIENKEVIAPTKSGDAEEPVLTGEQPEEKKKKRGRPKKEKK